eukprot:1182276-Prorocentrum_minimum.AAC.3
MTNSVATKCKDALVAKGLPVAVVHLDETKLKGGYICDTMRLEIEYTKEDETLPKTMVLKMEMPTSNDHQVAMDLHLYDREWHFYETMSALVPVRVPKYYGTVLSEDGKQKIGVIMEDLCLPGSVLDPKLDEAGVMLTVKHCAEMHAKFWNNPDLEVHQGRLTP